MNPVVAEALTAWGLDGAAARLVARRENEVWRIDHDRGAFALRLHRPGYRSDAELRSELAWMAACRRGGVAAPAPVADVDGAFLRDVRSLQVDLLHWLDGAPMSAPGGPLAIHDRTGAFAVLGEEMARLHTVSDAWPPPAGFIRPEWDRRGLLGETPLWGRFWENPRLSSADAALLSGFRDAANAALAEAVGGLDYGLIHADLVSSNVLVDGPRAVLIDFDDGGYGFRLFDIATALLKHMDEPDYLALRDALLDGYLRRRALDLDKLDLFLAIRAASYVGWNIARIAEDGAETRNARFVRKAIGRATAWLDAHRVSR